MTSTPKPPRTPLSEAEYKELCEQERRIWDSYEDGAHFAYIAGWVSGLKKRGLWARSYRGPDSYPIIREALPWKAYCRYLPYGRRYADRLCKIDAVYTALTVATFGKPEYAMLKPAEIAWLPTHEKHCEALAIFDADLWVPIWEAVKSSGKRITEASIRDAGASVARFERYQAAVLARVASTPTMADFVANKGGSIG